MILQKQGPSPLSEPSDKAYLYYTETVDSTMTLAGKLVREGYPGGTAVRTDFQLHGRGRGHNRQWQAAHGTSLLTTIILRNLPPSTAPESLPLRTGLALALLIEGLLLEGVRPPRGLTPRGPDPVGLPSPQIKWPNDLILGGRKTAGVLCEMGRDFFLLGVGLNVKQESFPPPPEGVVHRYPPTSLLREGFPPERLTLDALWQSFLEKLALTLGLKEPDYPWRQELEHRLFLRGQEIGFVPGAAGEEAVVRGRLGGVSVQGALLLEIPGESEPRLFWAGEICPERDDSV